MSSIGTKVEVTPELRVLLRDLIDDAWNAATDSGEVPHPKWADEIIDTWAKRHNDKV